MRRSDGGGRHDRPFRHDEYPAGAGTATIEQTSRETPTLGIQAFGRPAPRPRGCRARRPRTLEPEHVQDLAAGSRAGHDGRRAVGMQAGHLAPLVERQRGQAGAQLLEPLARDHVALDAGGVVGLELEVDRRAARSPSRRPRPPPPTRSRTSAGRRPRSRPRTSARAPPSPRPVGGSECRWRSVWRTTPACVETWKRPRRARRRPARSSRRRCRSRAAASSPSRAAVAPRKVSRASSSPLSVRPSSP